MLSRRYQGAIKKEVSRRANESAMKARVGFESIHNTTIPALQFDYDDRACCAGPHGVMQLLDAAEGESI
jgi:hypothetical protein